MQNKKDEFDIRPKTDPLPRIPEGEYEAVCFKVEVSRYLGSEKKLYVHFRIINGEYQGTELFETLNFNYKSFPRGSKYYTDWSIANGKLPIRKDKMSPKVFKEKAFLVKVRDVKPKHEDGTTKPEIFWYSVIDRIIEKVAG